MFPHSFTTDFCHSAIVRFVTIPHHATTSFETYIHFVLFISLLPFHFDHTTIISFLHFISFLDTNTCIPSAFSYNLHRHVLTSAAFCHARRTWTALHFEPHVAILAPPRSAADFTALFLPHHTFCTSLHHCVPATRHRHLLPHLGWPHMATVSLLDPGMGFWSYWNSCRSLRHIYLIFRSVPPAHHVRSGSAGSAAGGSMGFHVHTPLPFAHIHSPLPLPLGHIHLTFHTFSAQFCHHSQTAHSLPFLWISARLDSHVCFSLGWDMPLYACTFLQCHCCHGDLPTTPALSLVLGLLHFYIFWVSWDLSHHRFQCRSSCLCRPPATGVRSRAAGLCARATGFFI